MNRMNFIDLLYNQKHSLASLLSGIDSILSTEYTQLTIIPYACKDNPIECFESHSSTRSFTILDYNDEVALIKLVFNSSYSNSEATPIEGKFFVCKHPSLPNIFLVMTIEPIDFFRRALLPFIEQHGVRFYLTFLKHEYLHQLLVNYKNNRNYTDLTVTRASHVNRFGAGKRETMIPTVSWPELSLEAVFSYAQEQNAWFRSLSFQARRDTSIATEVTIYRNGIIKTNRDFKGVYNNLVLPICNLIDENIKLFDKRARRDNPNLDVKPLVVQFGRDQFKDVAENARFITAMRKLDNASVSVQHGNPYISMSVVDYSDGSTFDLMVLNSDELIIVPQLKSSVPAMKRLISCVFDNYAEGNLFDYRQVSR